MPPILEADLRRYLAAGLIRGISVLRTSGGWLLQVQMGTETAGLRRQRGGERIFKSLDKLADFIGELGLERFDVQLRN